tara:strand:+ start:13 stop:1014 length:1002 start_codon:yes stop_codon:yes gene_type:complete
MNLNNLLSEFEIINNDWKKFNNVRIKKIPYNNIFNDLSYIGVDNNYFHLYINIDLSKNNTPIKIHLSEIFGFELSVITINKNESLNVIDIYTKKEYINYFSSLIIEYSKEFDINDPISSLYKSLKKIKAYLSSLKSPLNKEQEKGLFGELFILNELSSIISIEDLIKNNWQNQNKNSLTLHDFIFKNIDIEVKTTSSEPVDIHVSSIQQLIPQKNKKLYLIVNKIFENDNGTTLIQLINLITNKFSSDSLKETFHEILALNNYYKKHDLHYTTKFSITDILKIEIDDNTPIINPKILSEIPSNIFNIQYSLHIDSMNYTKIKNFDTFIEDITV